MPEPQVTNIRKLVINKCTEEQYNAMVKNADELYLTPDTGGGGGGSGTVTSVRVQATSPVVSSQNTAQTTTLNTTISLANNYGDTKNPYASKTKNYVLAAPSTANGAPTFRALDKADIPIDSIIDDSTITKNSNDQIQTIGIKDVRTDNTIKTWTGTEAQYTELIPTDWTVATYNSNLGDNSYSWHAVSSDGTKFLAISNGGYVSTSTDGITWSVATLNSQLASAGGYWNKLCYDGTKFLAISGYHYYVVSTSTDGLNWTTPIEITNLEHRENATALCYGNGKYVLSDEYGRISISTDGTTWSDFTDAEPLNYCSSIIYANNKFISPSGYGRVMTSTDGITWTSNQCTNLNGHSWDNLGYDGSKFTAISYNGYVTTSTDGLNWTVPTQNTNLSSVTWYSNIAYNGAKFVIISGSGYVSTKDKGGEGVDSNTLYNVINNGLYLGTTPIADIGGGGGGDLPDPTGQSGKFLTTDGSTLSWGTVPAGTVTSVRVQAGTGLSSSQSTAQTSTLNTTISIASGYKLPTTTEWSNKQDTLPSQSGNSGKFLTTNGTTMSWATVQGGGSGKFLTFTNVYVDAMYWTHDNTYADYPYSATITCQGVTSSDFAYVVFAPGDFNSGIYANVCLTGTDTVTIYGKSDVYTDWYQGVTIPTIVVIGA